MKVRHPHMDTPTSRGLVTRGLGSQALLATPRGKQLGRADVYIAVCVMTPPQVKSALLVDTIAAMGQQPGDRANWMEAQNRARAERLYSATAASHVPPARRPLSAVPRSKQLAAAAAALDEITAAADVGGGGGSSGGYGRGAPGGGGSPFGGSGNRRSYGGPPPSPPHIDIDGSYGLMPPSGPRDPYRVGRYTQVCCGGEVHHTR